MPQNASPSFSIGSLNRASESQAVAMLDRVVECSAWLAHRAAAARPFRDAADLSDWLDREVRTLPRDEAMQLLCAHPELAPPDPAAMTPASQSEQGRLDLLDPDPETAGRLAELNRRYIQRHGYPFVIALHAQRDLAGVFDQFESRLAADPDEELPRSLCEVVSVMRSRLARLTGNTGPGAGPAPAAPASGQIRGRVEP